MTAAPPPTRRYESVAVGDELDPLVLPITATLIVAGAVASRDYQDVHHDRALARAGGAPDIFMNILTTNGLVGRFVTDWTGPAAVLRDVVIRLGAPNHPDDTMTLTGTVVAKGEVRRGATHASVDIAVRGANAVGEHVTGTVTVALPLGDGGR